MPFPPAGESLGSIAARSVFICTLAAVLAFAYNGLSEKPLALVRSPRVLAAVADSALFSTPTATTPAASTPVPPAPARDTARRAPSRSDSARVAARPLSTTPVATPPPATPAPAQQSDAAPSGQTVTLAQAKRLLDEHRAVFVDARDAGDYEAGHLPGAKSLPFHAFGDAFPAFASTGHDLIVVTYCGGGSCELSSGLAETLRSMGYAKVYLFEEGYNGWIGAGYAVEKGAAK